MTLRDKFDPRANGLNFLRLVLATSVIIWHSYPLTGRDLDSRALVQGLELVPVDGFFAISGFLIAGSWVRRPDVRAFLRARVLRIFPGFWACLVITALVLAPLGLWLSKEATPQGYAGQAVGYAIKNSTLSMTQYDIAGTPADVPYANVWNGSLWTLRWEFACYLGILALGVIGVLRRPRQIAVCYAVAVIGLLAVGYGPLGGDTLTNATRFSVMFLAGTLVYVLQDRLPGGLLAALAASGVVVASLFMHDYQIVAAPFLAYALITLGAHITSPRLRLRNDVSYGVYIYAFPVQQILAGTAAVTWSIAAFSAATVALTLPLAIASWFLVERPSLRFKGVRRPSAVQEAAVAKD